MITEDPWYPTEAEKLVKYFITAAAKDFQITCNHYLGRTKGPQNTDEHTNLSEASIAMSALWCILLNELWVYGPISVESQIQKCGALKQGGFTGSTDLSLK